MHPFIFSFQQPPNPATEEVPAPHAFHPLRDTSFISGLETSISGPEMDVSSPEMNTATGRNKTAYYSFGFSDMYSNLSPTHNSTWPLGMIYSLPRFTIITSVPLGISISTRRLPAVAGRASASTPLGDGHPPEH